VNDEIEFESEQDYYDRCASGDSWLATVVRSPLDDRVWCACLPSMDQVAGAMHASTSVRRAKAYAEEQARQALDHLPDVNLVWVRESADTWALVENGGAQ